MQEPATTAVDLIDHQFIELGRTFHELSPHAENDESNPYPLLQTGKLLRWADLLQEHRVILLSEAGAGKTEEIRNVARRLRSEGKRAFFLRLEHVARDFEIAFEEGSFEELSRWIASDGEAWLFLDSIDESRLRDPRDFEAAIRKLGHVLGSAKQRVHIVITGRTTAWRPSSDLALCTNQLPFAKPTTSASDEPGTSGPSQKLRTKDTRRDSQSLVFKIVALDDLSSGQIEIFASARGVKDTKALLDAVERTDAWSFTSRPQDLEELLDFWKDHQRIGSRLELMRNSIDRRLRERDQDRADARPLSLDRVRFGAKLVAAAVTMTQESTIRVPDGANNIKGLPVASILCDWDDSDCATLLARPIFDEAIYGTVRFHHRSVREYLTAEWLADLLKKQTSRRRIEELFFREQYGLEVVVPAMRPILPWLAIFDDRITERTRQLAPEVFFEGGDPSQLPLETRRQILHQVCSQVASGATKRSMMDYTAVQRFARGDLAKDIKGLIKKYSTHRDLLPFLLRMVWHGQLVEALPEAKRVACERSSISYARIAAFRAVFSIGSADDATELRQTFLREASELDRNLLAELVAATHPSSETMEWLFDCVRKVESKKPHTIDKLPEEVALFVEKADNRLCGLFVERANELLEHTPVIERRHCEISEKLFWLIGPVGRAVERLVKLRSPNALYSPSLAVLHKLSISAAYDSNETTKLDLATLVPRWPELNQRLFWYLVEQERRWLDHKKNERLTDWWSVSRWGSYTQFSSQDFELILSAIDDQPLVDDKLIALSLAFSLYVSEGRPQEWRRKLKRAASNNAELSARLSRLMRPPAQTSETQKHKKWEANWKRRNERRRQKEELDHERSRQYLSENTDKLREPGLDKPDQVSSAQYYVHERMREKDQRSSSWSEGNWEILKDEFGDEVAHAFRDGVVAYWRRYTPKLVSEGAPTNETEFATIFGLTGLAIEAREADNWLSTLSEPEAAIAFRYAMRELNGFPDWFPKLFTKFPELIQRMALEEIRHELSVEDEETDSSYLLSDVSWSGDWLWEEIAPSLYEIVAHNEPRNTRNLQHLLIIIQGSSIPAEKIAALASRKCTALERLDHIAHWFAVWVGVAPEDAIPALEKRLKSILDKSEQTTFAMIFVVQLLGGRRDGGSKVRDAFRTPEYLKSLYLLLHYYVLQDEDIDRIGTGVYSPGLRDDAQDARDRLFALIREIPGKDAFLAIDEIARNHPAESSRPWFTLHARTKAELDADNRPWSPGQVREFHNEQERTPANHRDLFDLAVMRFLDLKDDLESGDSSNASILRNVRDEIELRKFIGNWCRQSAQGRYSIPQEEELADAKRPDLRWHGVGFDAPLPVELKIADNWTGPALFKGLEEQLCGAYLRDIRSGRGIFLLIHDGHKKEWELPGGKGRVDFEGLLRVLQAHWSEIASRYPGVDEIRVLGIDLTSRSLPKVDSTPARTSERGRHRRVS